MTHARNSLAEVFTSPGFGYLPAEQLPLGSFSDE